MSTAIPRYGVHKQARSESAVERAAESLSLVGYAVIDAGLAPGELAELSAAFDRALAKTHEQYGRDVLEKIDEHNTIRAPLASGPVFLDLALNPNVLAVCRRLIVTDDHREFPKFIVLQ